MLAWILDPRRAALLFSGALAVAYGVVPLVMGAVGFDPSFTKLGVLTLVSCAAILTGSLLPVGSVSIARTGVDGWVFVAIVWIPFIAFALLALATADEIPLVASLSGADPETIAILRERFLKAREGWQSSFVYINALFTAALIPYTLALMFVTRMKLRWLCFAFFLAYCLSFVEKTFFLKAMIPLISLLALERIRTPVGGRAAVAGALALLLALTVLSGAGQAEQETGGDFVSLQYAPQGAVEHIVWRSGIVPLITAGDSIRVFDETFNSTPLLGATSSLLAFLFGMERVPFERLVFFDQWGQNETGTGSSNSVFVTEAYINFGMTGVIAISLIIGIMFQAMATSRDDALRALWPLLAFSLFTSGFIGVMASNGFALLFLVLLFFRLHDERRNSLLPIAKQHKILILKEINS